MSWTCTCATAAACGASCARCSAAKRTAIWSSLAPVAASEAFRKVKRDVRIYRHQTPTKNNAWLTFRTCTDELIRHIMVSHYGLAHHCSACGSDELNHDCPITAPMLVDERIAVQWLVGDEEGCESASW